MGKFVTTLGLIALPILAGCGGGGDVGRPAVSKEQEERALQLYREALVLEEHGKLSLALETYTAAVEIHSGIEDVVRDRRAKLNEKTGNVAAAESDLTTAITLKPNEAIYYNNRGQYYQRRERYNEAERDLTRAITLDKGVPEFFMNRALLYMDMKKYDEALRDFDILMLFSPIESTRKQIELLIKTAKEKKRMSQ